MENEKHTYIVRTGEVALKGMNKPYFEKVLLGRIKNALKDYKNVEAYRKEGLIFVKTPAEYPEEEVEHTILNVFGVASLSSAVETESDMEKIGEAAAEYMKKLIPQRNIKTFKVEAKRADKSFPVQSPEIASRIGGYVLKANDGDRKSVV